jgi:hypothetical protein
MQFLTIILLIVTIGVIEAFTASSKLTFYLSNAKQSSSAVVAPTRNPFRDNMKMQVTIPLPTNAALSASRGALNVLRSQLNKISLTWKAVFVLFVALFSQIQGKLTNNVRMLAANAMESGWSKRGYGGAIGRSLEVWGFAIGFGIKYVSFST